LKRADYGAEERLLLCCARAEPRGADVAELAGGVADWGRVLRLAASHGVSAFLFTNIDGQAPPAVVEELRERAQGIAVENLILTAELPRVMEALESAGIPALAFKGPTLAALLYGERMPRESSDIDVLVHEEDVARSFAVLGELGYEAWHAVEGYFFECGRERPVVQKNNGATVDVHWGLMPTSFAADTGAEGVWKRCGRVRIGKRDIPTLGDEDLVQFLCVHGTKHRWASLGWVCDVAALVHARPGIGWEAVMRRAQRTGTRRAVLLGLYLAHDLVGAEAPAQLLAEARQDRKLQDLARESAVRMFQEPPSAHGGRSYWYRASERWRERLWLVRGAVFEAQPADRQAYKLPRVLFPLYRVIRPFRLAVRHAGRIRRRAGAVAAD
jgi:hypothetical protein